MASRRTRIRRQLREFEHKGIFEVDVEEFQGPKSWSEIFQRQAPLELEVGFGKGEFIRGKAQENPDKNYVGIEIDSTRLRWAEYKIHKDGLANIRLVFGDARKLIQALFHDGQLDATYMNFPDPWPKKRHIHRRMICQPMIDELIRIVKPGGSIYIVTDVVPYAKEGLECLENREQQVENVLGKGSIANNLDGYPETIHEWKFRREGRTINFLHFRKLG